MYKREVEVLKAKMDSNPIFRANVLTAYAAAMESDPGKSSGLPLQNATQR